MKIGQMIGMVGVVVGVLVSSCSPQETVHETDPTQLYHLVNPFIGTGAHGHTYPGVCAPHGMVQLSPDTRWEGWDACSGYHYSDDSLYGFSHTHLSGTGCSDLSDVLLIPTVEAELYRDSIAQANLPKQAFSHEDETAHAGYYRVRLASGIEAELTATSLVGAHRYTFPKGQEAHLVIDLVNLKHDQMRGASLRVLSDTEVCGHQITDGWVENQQVYFYAKFSTPMVSSELYLHGALSRERQIEGDSVRGLFTFGEQEAPLEVFVGISQTSIEAAKNNLEHDLRLVAPAPTFDAVRAFSEQTWNKELSKVIIPRGAHDDLVTFYTALYHALLTPSRVSDVDGSYRGMDDAIHRMGDGRTAYSTFSLWDTYRALHPLLTLIDHAQVQDYVASMMQMYKESGELPIWPLASGETRTMIGYHAVSVMADAYLRGITQGMSLDLPTMLEAMVTSSLINRKGAQEYEEFGWIPANRRNESVSCTLEYSYDDWCIAQVAQKMGNQAVYEKYHRRAQNFIHLFDGSTSFFRGRYEDGSWGADFDPYEVSKDFTEANAWQYRFGAQHDIHGMIQLHGGEDAFAQALDALFADHPNAPKVNLQDITGLVGQYAHGNEPSHHIAYLYNYVGQPWKTQELTRRLLSEQYGATPEGIVGNEDCGQMSAWYLFTALGMYPVTPGSGQYVLTSPLFEEVTLTLANGKSLTIHANNPNQNRYIQSVKLNGKAIERLYLTYDDLMAGGELEFTLSNQPNKQSAQWERPYSQTKGQKPSPVYATQDLSLFHESITFELKSATPDAQIHYTIDGSEPTTSSPCYSAPLTLEESTLIRAIALLDGQMGDPVTLHATKAEYHQPTTSTHTGSGVHFILYAGQTNSTRDIEKLMKVVKTGTASDINIEHRDREDDFALIFTGAIEIKEAGVYEFQLTSDDGSVLTIWNQPVVLNDGSHSFVSATGKMALAPGLHPFELRYWQGAEGKGLRLLMRKRGAKEYSTPTYFTMAHEFH